MVFSLASETFGSSNGIDAERGARDCGRELPSKELGAKAVDARRQAQDGMTRGFERVQPVGVGRVDFGGDGDKRAILAVLVGTPQRFVDDRQRARAALARALGDELFDPETERREPRRQSERQLVASAPLRPRR